MMKILRFGAKKSTFCKKKTLFLLLFDIFVLKKVDLSNETAERKCNKNLSLLTAVQNASVFKNIYNLGSSG